MWESVGMSTCSTTATSGTSMPRAATSVATRVSSSPWRKRFSVRVRVAWGRSPDSGMAEKPSLASISATSAASVRRRTKIRQRSPWSTSRLLTMAEYC